MLISVVLACLLIVLAVPGYQRQLERSRVAKAEADIRSMHIAIERFRLANSDRVTITLTELRMEIPRDPWGRDYQFLNIIDANPSKGLVRKDGALNPLNTDYDLYSLGRDGDSKGPLNAKASRDDVVRANNGAYIGLGRDY